MKSLNSTGIRAIAECLAKSRSDETQENARHLLQTLAQGNPLFENQVTLLQNKKEQITVVKCRHTYDKN